MSTREEALKKLRAQITEQRKRLDPKVLRAAARAAELAQNPEKAAENMVPYDRQSAAEAIRLFLDAHENQTEFQAKLLRMLKQQEH
jgi:putative IMPACT (imprinted ancient) family translation regulator